MMSAVTCNFQQLPVCLFVCMKATLHALQAAEKPAQSIERMLYVAAFAVSSYSGTNNRYLKPFNPLLGETFEFEYPEQNWRGMAEKVQRFLLSFVLARGILLCTFKCMWTDYCIWLLYYVVSGCVFFATIISSAMFMLLGIL